MEILSGILVWGSCLDSSFSFFCLVLWISCDLGLFVFAWRMCPRHTELLIFFGDAARFSLNLVLHAKLGIDFQIILGFAVWSGELSQSYRLPKICVDVLSFSCVLVHVALVFYSVSFSRGAFSLLVSL